MKDHKSLTNLLSITFSIVTIVAVAYILMSISLHSSTTISYLLLISALVIILICCVSIDSVLRHTRLSIMIFIALIYAILLRVIYIFRTHALVEPLYDGYKDLSVAFLIQKERALSLLSKPYLLSYSSSFPSLEILTMFVTNILSFSILSSALLLSVLMGILVVTVIYLLTRKVIEGVHVPCNSRIVVVALILIAIWPELIYQSVTYYSRHYFLTLYYILMYLFIAREQLTPLALFIAFSLPFSHALFPAITIVLFGVLIVETILAKKISSKSYLLERLKVEVSSLNLKWLTYVFIALFMGETIWFTYYVAREVLYGNRWFLQSLVNALYNLLSRPPSLARPWDTFYYIPPALLNPFNMFVPFKDYLLYLTAPLGLLLLVYFQTKLKKPFTLYGTRILFLLPAYLIVHLLFVEGGPIGIQTTLHLMVYLIILFSSLAYTYMLCSKNKALKALITSILILSLIIASLSLWSHRLFLIHYYDTRISFEEAGDHNIAYIYIEEFLKAYLDPESIKNIYTDEPYSLGLWMFRRWIPQVQPKSLLTLSYTADDNVQNSLIVVMSNEISMTRYNIDPQILFLKKKMVVEKMLLEDNIIYQGTQSFTVITHKV